MKLKILENKKQKVLILDINDSTEEQKSKLRGAIKIFVEKKIILMFKLK